MNAAVGATVSDVQRAVASVLDPCSRFNGTLLSFVDLGMIDAIEVDDAGAVEIRLLLDDPTCVYLPEILLEMRDAILCVPGVTAVQIRLRSDRLWTEERLTDETREKLREWREARFRRMQLMAIEPLRHRGSRTQRER